MKDYIVEADYVSISSGIIKLTKEQASARDHALEKTKEAGVYNIIAKTGFKKGEVFSYDGDISFFVKSGVIFDATPDASSEENSAAKDKKAAK